MIITKPRDRPGSSRRVQLNRMMIEPEDMDLLDRLIQHRSADAHITVPRGQIIGEALEVYAQYLGVTT